MNFAIFNSSSAISEPAAKPLKSIFWAVILAPAKNLDIETKKNSIYLKLAPVKIRKASVTINIIDDFKFLLPCVSKFLRTIGFIFISFGFKNKNKFKKACSRKGIIS